MENKINRALISVTDKSNLELIAKELVESGCEIISSGGTGRHLSSFDIPWTPVESITGNPEAFSGRMKTLSFQISSSLLFKRDCPNDLEEANRLNIKPIDLVICNFYPFADVYKQNKAVENLVENIDIGGPTMIRSAAKNYEHVTVLTDPSDYSRFIENYKQSLNTRLEYRKECALKAFQYTANYESIIFQGLSDVMEAGSKKKKIEIDLNMGKTLRYGENPSQWGCVVSDPLSPVGMANSKFLQGKELSYNNLLDGDAAFRTCSELDDLFPDKKIAVIIKHANPCGASISLSEMEAISNAWDGDRISSFGSIICFNYKITKEVAIFLNEKFVEVVIAPSFEKEALEVLKRKKNVRLLELTPKKLNEKELMVKSISGGWVVQNEDTIKDLELDVITENMSVGDSIELIRFGIIVTKFLKSNAISIVAKKGSSFVLAGAGMGNPNRLISVEQACEKSIENGFSLDDCILISDAFFPFRDNIDLLGKKGITKIVQPGGSIKDDEVINACNEHNISMCFSKNRHFRH